MRDSFAFEKDMLQRGGWKLNGRTGKWNKEARQLRDGLSGNGSSDVSRCNEVSFLTAVNLESEMLGMNSDVFSVLSTE